MEINGEAELSVFALLKHILVVSPAEYVTSRLVDPVDQPRIVDGTTT
jgi:hypothetical protein